MDRRHRLSAQRQIASADLDALVLTRRHWALLGLTGGASDHLIQLIQMEMSERVRDLTEAVATLDAQIARWRGGGHLVVPDASVYIQHPSKLRDLDFAADLGFRGDAIRIIAPIAVIDELDGLKSARGDNHRRWRAGYSLAVFDTVLRDPTGWGLLRPADMSALDHGGIPRGEVRLEIVFDAVGHARLPIADDEIIDRALAIQTIAGRPVTLMTFDTGQSTRGRAAGLRVAKLDQRPEEEP